MLEVKFSILEGVNKRIKVPDLIRSMHWDTWKVPNTGSAAHSWKGIA